MNSIFLRNVINKLEEITESVGLANRTQGAKFKNDSGEEIIFKNLKFYPESGGKYTPEELQEKLKEFPNVTWLNQITSKSGGFGIARFIDDSGQEVLIAGQFMEKISPNFKKNYIPNEILGFKLDTAASKKTKEKLKPQDLLTDKINLTIPKIMQQLASSLGTDNSLYELAHKIATGHPLPITIDKPDNFTFTGFRDYFCEILQPMAIQMGQYTGNAAEAAEKFLNGSFQKSFITFDDSVTAGLSDSIISTSDGKYVLISTKGGTGAKASAKNLYDKIIQLEQSDDGGEFLNKHKEVVDIIKNIVKFGQNGSPLYLAVKFKIINSAEADQIKNLRDKPLVNLSNISSIPISEKLQKFASERKTKTPEQTDLYYHLMASIAEKAADEVNNNTNFGKVAAEILNNGALVQVYTKAKENKSQWILEEFETVYPSDNIKGVFLNSGKTYYSTDIKGNFTFMIDKGEGIPEDDTVNTTATAADISTDFKQEKQRAKRDITTVFKKKLGSTNKSVSSAGREKR